MHSDWTVRASLAVITANLALCVLDADVRSLVGDYFTARGVRELAVYACSDRDRYSVMKQLAATRLWMSAPDHEAGISTLKTEVLYSHHKRGVFVDCTCDLGKTFLEESSRQLLLTGRLAWLVLGAEEPASRPPLELNLSLDSEVTWAWAGGLYDLHSVARGWPTVVTPAGRWTPLHYNLAAYKYHARSNLQGLAFNAGILVNDFPVNDLENQLVLPEYKKKELLATYNYAIFQFLMQQFNFTLKLLPTTSAGYVVDWGRYEGLVRMMAEGHVDLHVSAVQLNKARLRHMEPTGHTWKFRLCSVFRHPPVTGGPDFLLLPFTGDLWLALAAVCVLAVVVVQLVFWAWAWYGRPCTYTMSASDILLMVVGCIGLQGYSGDSQLGSWRIAFLSFLVLSLLSYASYSASIVSALLSEVPRTITTARLLIDSKLRFGVEDTPYKLYFQKNTDAVAHELYSRKMQGEHGAAYLPLDVGVRKVLDEHFALHAEDTHVYRAIEDTFPEQKKCSLTEVQVFPPQMCFVPIRRDSPFKELLTYGLRRVAECGLLDHHNRAWRPRKPTCVSSGEVAAVGLEALTPAFAILVVGVLLSLCLLLLELLHYHRYRWQGHGTEKRCC